MKLEYINLITKEIVHWTKKEYEEMNPHGYVLLDDIKNKTVLISINDYKLLDEDVFGFKKNTVVRLIQNGFKAWDNKSADTISRYYHICPYCTAEAKVTTNDDITIDVGNDFNKIITMKFDIIQNHKCTCGNRFKVYMELTAPTLIRAEILKKCLEKDMFVIVKCSDKYYGDMYIDIKELMIYMNKEVNKDIKLSTLKEKPINISNIKKIDNKKIYRFIKNYNQKIKMKGFAHYE